jgi:hypothetical protein
MWEGKEKPEKQQSYPVRTIDGGGRLRKTRETGFYSISSSAFKLPTVGFNLDCWTHGLGSKANQGMGKHHRWPSLVTAKLPEEVDGYQRCGTSIPR